MKISVLQYSSFVLGFILLAGLLSCCQSKKKPADILSPEEMVKTMTAVYIGEQKVGGLNLSVDSAKIVFSKIQGKIFEVAGVPDSIFKKSFDYYIERPKELELIYTALIDSLNLQEQRLNVSAPPQATPQ